MKKFIVIAMFSVLFCFGCVSGKPNKDSDVIQTKSIEESSSASKNSKSGSKVKDYLVADNLIATSSVSGDISQDKLVFKAYKLPRDFVKKVFSDNEKYIWFTSKRNAHMFERNKYINENKDILEFSDKDNFSVISKYGDKLIVSKMGEGYSVILGNNTYITDLDNLEKEFLFSDEYSGRAIEYTDGRLQLEFIKECQGHYVKFVVDNVNADGDIKFEGASVFIWKRDSTEEKQVINLHDTDLCKTFDWKLPSNFQKIVNILKNKGELDKLETEKFIKVFMETVYQITQEDFVK